MDAETFRDVAEAACKAFFRPWFPGALLGDVDGYEEEGWFNVRVQAAPANPNLQKDKWPSIYAYEHHILGWCLAFQLHFKAQALSDRAKYVQMAIEAAEHGVYIQWDDDPRPDEEEGG